MHSIRLSLFAIILSSLFVQTSAQTVRQKLPETTRILFLLDGSGSMLAEWEGGLRIQAAKEILTDLVDSLQVNPNVELALRAYGHQHLSRERNCKDTRLEIGFEPNNHQKIIQRLQYVKPKGTTPIAYSLEQAASDFPNDPDARNVIIIITDGIESCGGDPCAVSQKLQQKGIFLRPFVIGLGMDEKFQEEFNCLGKFFDASSRQALKKRLNQALTETMETATLTIDLLDVEGDPTITDLNVTFLNQASQEPQFEFIHYLDEKGRPDSVKVDPIITYDLVVSSVPEVIKKGVNPKGGQHTHVEIPVPLGQLQIEMKDHTEYQNLKAVISLPSGKIISEHEVGATLPYIQGEYKVDVFTTPRRTFDRVTITGNKTKSIRLEQPGVVNIDILAPGNAFLYELHPDNRQTLIKSLDTDKKRHSFAMQPGKYKIVYRADRSPGSKYTIINEFEIRSGETESVGLTSR